MFVENHASFTVLLESQCTSEVSRKTKVTTRPHPRPYNCAIKQLLGATQPCSQVCPLEEDMQRALQQWHRKHPHLAQCSGTSFLYSPETPAPMTHLL
ncbi:uncharacterized [Tachysurus ichikawai]